jgi:PTH1 family peptidyl-tRNA hydrolase
MRLIERLFRRERSTAAGSMKIVVGLGNPGRKYQGTRHNVGFDVLDEIARKHGAAQRKAKFDGEMTEVALGGERTILLWPFTYMNRSGQSVGRARDFYKLENADLLVVCDDINLPLAKLRFRAHGSAGGQKGLADILRRLGTQEVARLRVGVGPVPEGWDATEFVLGKFGRDDAADIEQAVWRAADAVSDWIGRGVEFCMNQYN